MPLNRSKYFGRPTTLNDKSEQGRGVCEKALIQRTVVRVLRIREALGQTQHVGCETRLARMDGADHLTRIRRMFVFKGEQLFVYFGDMAAELSILIRLSKPNARLGMTNGAPAMPRISA